MKKKKTIGFDRRIQLDWLDATADWKAQGLALDDIRVNLNQLLEGRVSGKVKDGALRKTVTVLSHIWLSVPNELEPLRDQGLALFCDPKVSDRLALHWGMCMASYPFFHQVLSQIGRLRKLQAEFTLDQIRRRVAEGWGDTERVRRSVRHVVQTLRDWAILVPLQEKGVYRAAKTTPLNNTKLKAWLVEALILGNRANMVPLRHLSVNPAFFPFSLTIGRADIAANPRLDIFRQNIDEDVVMLRGN